MEVRTRTGSLRVTRYTLSPAVQLYPLHFHFKAVQIGLERDNSRAQGKVGIELCWKTDFKLGCG